MKRCCVICGVVVCVLLGLIVLVGILAYVGSSNDEDVQECAGVYLKSQGLLDREIPTSKQQSMCLSVMRSAVRDTRASFDNLLQAEMPNKAQCVMNEFDGVGFFDLSIKSEYITNEQTISSTEKQTIIDAIERKIAASFAAISVRCGVDLDELGAVIDKLE